MENDNHATVSVDDCRLLTLDRHHHENGNLTVVENGKDFPFEVQRVFYIYDVPGGTDRGGHFHRRRPRAPPPPAVAISLSWRSAEVSILRSMMASAGAR